MENVIPADTIVTKQSVLEVVKNIAQTQDQQVNCDSFYVYDVGDVFRKYELWMKELPHVKPYYAFKCNGDPVVVKLLMRLGLGFDCASKEEIREVLDHGVPPHNIIYAHPYKQVSHLKFARSRGVDLMTFDNPEELRKIKNIYPSARLVLRIKPSAKNTAGIDFTQKFGIPANSVEECLQVAKSLELNVIGVSFHIGTPALASSAYASAIADAHFAFTVGKRLGFRMELLDIGGGFQGCKVEDLEFTESAAVIRDALTRYFPAGCGVRVIAEPGRFFNGSAMTLATKITGKKIKYARTGLEYPVVDLNKTMSTETPSGELEMHYVVNEGLYGSFGGFLMREVCPEPIEMREVLPGEPCYESVVWGRSADDRDRLQGGRLAELSVGDWLIYCDVGAYYAARQRPYEGYTRNKQIRYIDTDVMESAHQRIKELQSKLLIQL